MKYTILKTGSDGNCAVAEFSDGKKVLFDCGKGMYKKFCEAGFKIEEFSGAFCSHKHEDHFGDFHKVDIFFMRNMGLNVLKLPVNHNVDCSLYIVSNHESKEMFIYSTDYSSVPKNTEEIILSVARRCKKDNYKLFAILELNYCEFLFKKLPKEMQYGSISHFSDESFFQLAKKFLAENNEMRIVSTHASQRQSLKLEASNGWNGTICPPDYVKLQIQKRLKTNRVSFGEARGTASPYYY